MNDPAKWDWRRKIETCASSLAGGLLFLRPIRPATASKLLFIRAHLGNPWFIFPSNRAAPVGCSELFVQFLLKLEREKSAGLRQLSLQHAYGGEM
jgi:hypothetical protein